MESGDQVVWTNPETKEAKNAIVDEMVDPRTVRIMLHETGVIEWVHPGELKALDTVSRLAQLDGSKTLEEQLEEIKREEGKSKSA